MPNFDIVARLALNAAQFSSEYGAKFADLKTRAASTATDVRNSFVGAFAEVNRLSQTAISLPRATTGSLDLSSEIASLNAAAAAAENRAVGLRELAIAQSAAANAAGVNTQAMRLEADASAVASLAEERLAHEIRDRILAMQAVQTELDRTTSATKRHTQAGQAFTVSIGQQRTSTMMLGQQVQDFFVQTSNGGSITTAFSQQIGQAAFALQGMGGSMSGVAAFLGSGWGAAFLVGATVMTPLVGKIIESNNALDNAVDKLKKDAAETELTAQAKERFKRTEEGVAAAIRESTEETKKAIEAERSTAERSNIAAKNNLAEEISIRRKTAAKLADALADAERAAVLARGMEGGGVGEGLANQRVDELRAKAAAQDARIAAAEERVQETRITLAAEAAARMADPLERIKKLYDDQATAAKNAAREQIKAGKDVTSALTGQLAEIDRKRAAAVKAEQDRQRDGRKKAPALGDQLETERSGRLLSSAERFRGLDENRDNGTLRDLFKQANVSVDPKMVAWCAAFVNAVLKTNGLPGTGSLSARSFLGYGEATDRPVKGDIVVSRRGTGNQGHVGFYEGTDSRGNVRVLGGNTGDRVGTQNIPRADVLGFRRAPSAADSYKAEEEAAKKLSEVNKQIAADVAGINARWDEQPRLIDRVTADTAKLRSDLDKLDAQPKTAETEKLRAAIIATIDVAKRGLTAPFDDLVRSQRESLAVQLLQLEGRDAEATALQTSLRLQQQQGLVSDRQLTTALQMAVQQERIRDALEDQNRIVGIYVGAVGNLQRNFDQFLDDLDRKPGDALKGFVSGTLDTFKRVRNDLLSNALFGGIDRDVEKYIRSMTGRQTMTDILEERASAAGDVLNKSVTGAGSELDRFVDALRQASSQIPGALSQSVQPERSPFDSLGQAANDNGASDDIVVIGKQIERPMGLMLNAAGAWGVGADRLVKNLEGLGVKLPESFASALRLQLPAVLQGASIFSSIGSQFGKGGSQIGGGLGAIASQFMSSNQLAALGPLAMVYQLAQSVMQPIGKSLGFSSGAVAIGGLPLGGLAKLFGIGRKVPIGSAGIQTDQYGYLGAGASSGNDANSKGGASSLAGGVASGLQQIAAALGANITGSSDVRIGMYDGKIRVNDHGGAIGGVKGSGAITFATEQEAIAFAIRDALKDGVLTGISQASQNILRSGQDVERALEKALMIESIPKDLKAMLDPVGAATDSLNTKWKKTLDALKEGGATTEQMTQAQQLYNLQLAEVKNNTTAVSQGLKDFMLSLKIGSASPYSLRDQESTALAQLQSFLAKINAGETIDQSKYQDAAQAYLDIERQLYGSTGQYFDALDAVQAATAKAIAKIDNAVPITPGVPDPFTKVTADGVQTGNEIADTHTNLLTENNRLLSALIAAVMKGGGGDGAFIGLGRMFNEAQAA